MALTCAYSPRTLNDNWFEERRKPAEAITATGGILARTPRAYEADIAYIGERFDVLARISRSQPSATYATPDDGFRVLDTTNGRELPHPGHREEFVANPPERPSLITTESVPEVSFEGRRPLVGPRRGFGAALSRHEDGRDQRYWNTSFRDTFGDASVQNTPRTKERVQCHPDMPSAGSFSMGGDGRIRGVQVGRLCGENFNETNDLAVNTKTQRAWLYAPDPALANVQDTPRRPTLPAEDNELSLNLGQGDMARVRADLRARQGKLFRVATCITTGLGQRGGINVFQDG